MKPTLQHSKEIKDIINKKPSFLLKWGNLFLLLALSCALLIANAISSRDIIPIKLKIEILNSDVGDSIIGRGIIPEEVAYRIKINQPVTINLNRPGHKEYGIVQGIVGAIDSCSRLKQHVVKVYFTDTKFKRMNESDTNKDLMVNAEILLSTSSLLTIIYNRLKNKPINVPKE